MAHTIALSTLGDAYVFGLNSSGQLGLSARESRALSPSLLSMTSPQGQNEPSLCDDEVVTDVVCGATSTLFLTETRKLYICGRVCPTDSILFGVRLWNSNDESDSSNTLADAIGGGAWNLISIESRSANGTNSKPIHSSTEVN